MKKIYALLAAVAVMMAAMLGAAATSPAQAVGIPHKTPCTGQILADCKLTVIGGAGALGSVFVRNGPKTGYRQPLNLNCVFGHAPAAPCSGLPIPRGGFKELVYKNNSSANWTSHPNWSTGNLSVGAVDNTKVITREYLHCSLPTEPPPGEKVFAQIILTAGPVTLRNGTVIPWRAGSWTVPCDGQDYEVSENDEYKFLAGQRLFINMHVAYQVKWNGVKDNYAMSIWVEGPSEEGDPPMIVNGRDNGVKLAIPSNAAAKAARSAWALAN